MNKYDFSKTITLGELTALIGVAAVEVSVEYNMSEASAEYFSCLAAEITKKIISHVSGEGELDPFMVEVSNLFFNM